MRPPGLLVVGALTLAFAVWPAAARPTAAAAASDWARNPQSQVRLVSRERAAARRGELRLGLQFRLAPGWHVYWKNSGDAGFAPILTLAAPGLSGGELLWPAPHRFELAGGLEAFGYAGEVVYPVRATLAAQGAGPLPVTADIDYLTCQVDCVPYRYRLTLLQPLGERPEPDPELAPLLDRWWRELPVPAGRLPGVSTGARLDAGRPGAPALEISVAGLASAEGGPDLFLEPNDELSTGRPETRRVPGGLVFRVPLRPKVMGRPLPARPTFAWTVTGLARAGEPLAIEARGVAVRAAGAAGSSSGNGTEAQGVSAQPGSAPGGGAPFGVGPVAAALLAALAVAGALACWDVLGGSSESTKGRQGEGGEGRQGAGGEERQGEGGEERQGEGGEERQGAGGEERRGRGARRAALGFAVLAAALAPLYLLAVQVRPEGLAGIELLLLAMALLAWLRRRARRATLRWILTFGSVVCAAGLLWLADHGRLAPTATRGEPHAQHSQP